jgi:hypothetical protein
MLEQSGFDHVRIGPAYDTFGGARGEQNARAFAVFGYAFLARSRGGVRDDDRADDDRADDV